MARVPTWKDRLRTLVVVGFGHLPEGRDAPKNAVPRGLAPEQVQSEFADKILAMDALITGAEQKFGTDSRLLDHPILGPLRAREWRKFHWVHGRHHLKQLRRLQSMVVDLKSNDHSH